MKRRAKIVATLGPKSSSEEMIKALLVAGVDVFRLNFSHGNYESHEELFNRIRTIQSDLGKNSAILQDISGPKIRIGEIDGAIYLEADDVLTFSSKKVIGSNESKIVNLSYKEILNVLKVGDKIFLADGTIKVEVSNILDDSVETKVLVGGKLTSKKGVNFPGVKLPISTITDKDRNDLIFGAKLGVDIVALSFVRCAEDVKEAKKILKDSGSETPVFAKIEMIEAMENIDSILEVVDGVMVARGDLGVEFGLPKVPCAQKELIKKANQKGLPVITATQMLISMVNSPYPTRAEVSDVANAILDGSDAVMLSDESAVGSYPVEAIKVLDETICETQRIYNYYQHKDEIHPHKEAIAIATSTLAETIKPDGVIVFTTTGASALTLAKYRPQCRIIVTSPSLSTLRNLSVVWGVESTIHMKKVENSDELVYRFIKNALAQNVININKTYILTVGAPKSESGSTNLIRVLNRDGMEYILNQFEKDR